MIMLLRDSTPKAGNGEMKYDQASRFFIANVIASALELT
jgi:hypothetical protein